MKNLPQCFEILASILIPFLISPTISYQNLDFQWQMWKQNKNQHKKIALECNILKKITNQSVNCFFEQLQTPQDQNRWYKSPAPPIHKFSTKFDNFQVIIQSYTVIQEMLSSCPAPTCKLPLQGTCVIWLHHVCVSPLGS